MLVASLVIDDATSVTVRDARLDIDGVYIIPVSVAEAEALAAAAVNLAGRMLADEIARKVTDPEPDGPLAAVSESELRALAGDR